MIRLKDLIREIMDALPPSPPAHIQQVAHQTSHTQAVNIENIYLLAYTLWMEARGEGTRGMQAVMNVIMNRAGGKFNLADEVVLRRKQFEVWNNISNPRPHAFARGKQLTSNGDKEFQDAVKIVELARKGQLKDITGGARFYYNPKKASPKWAKKMKKTATIGRHVFYK